MELIDPSYIAKIDISYIFFAYIRYLWNTVTNTLNNMLRSVFSNNRDKIISIFKVVGAIFAVIVISGILIWLSSNLLFRSSASIATDT